MEVQTITPLNLVPVDAARLAGVSRSRMFAMIKSGEIASFKLGRTRLVPVTAVHAWSERMATISAE